MIVALSLLAYGCSVALLGPRLIMALPAARRAPRLGALLWQIAASSVVATWAVAGVAMAVPLPALDGLGHLLTSCLTVVHEVAASPRSRAPQIAGLAISVGVLGRVGGCVTAGAVGRHRRRARHARMLRIVGRPAPEIGAVVLEHPTAMAYCLPGRRSQTVLTRGALDILTAPQLAAVLAHEDAHLRARHDLALAPIQALTRAFPRVPLFAAAAREMPVLLEMCADDAAARRHGSVAVVGALRSLSTAGAPEGTLAAGGYGAETRIDRLLRPSQRRLSPRFAFSSAVLFFAAGPLLAAAAPLVVAAATFLGYCPVSSVT